MKKKRAVLFDYDGVIANTPEDLFRAWNYAFFLHGKVKIDREQFFLLEGTPPQKKAEILGSRYKVDNDLLNSIMEEKEKYYATNNVFALNKGIADILDILKKKQAYTALVSGALIQRIKKSLSADIFNKFDSIITAEDVTVGKPDPEPYLKALQSLGLKPLDAIVVEDAPLGIKSASAAGIYCVAIESTLNKKYLNEADKIVEDFDELLLYFQSIF